MKSKTSRTDSLEVKTLVRKLICDVCGAEIPSTTQMEHNEAADEDQGSFTYRSGVKIHEDKDLCGSCARQVKQFIDDMK